MLAAHETGHHVQHDLAPGLVATTQETLAEKSARTAPTAGRPGAQEVFADALATLTVGPAAALAVEELQYGERPAVTVPSPGQRYPRR